MLTIPLDPEVLAKPSALQRLTRRIPRQHYFAMAKNRVLRGPGFTDEVRAISEEYPGDFADDFKADWLELLEEIVAYLASDGRFDEDEKAFAKEYVRVFNLGKAEIDSAYRRGVTHAFSRMVRSLASDGELTEQELQTLNTVARRFGLIDEDRDSAVRAALSAVVEEALEEILADEMISDAEWESFEALCRRLGVHRFEDPSRASQIHAARERWRISHGELEPIAVPGFRLPAKETAYRACVAEMFEQRRVRSGGVAEDQWTAIADGELILTNQRLLLRANNANNKSIRWNAVVGVQSVENGGLFVEKLSGKSPVFRFSGSSDQVQIMCLIAKRLFRES